MILGLRGKRRKSRNRPDSENNKRQHSLPAELVKPLGMIFLLRLLCQYSYSDSQPTPQIGLIRTASRSCCCNLRQYRQCE